jgi:hypothetical protein
MYSRTNFPNKKPGEQVIMYLRRHWIVLAKMIFIIALLVFIPLILIVIMLGIENLWQSEVFVALFTLGVSAYYLFVILFAFADFIDYYLDLWIVTDQRIINIEQKGLFSRTVSEKELIMMQDITADVQGVVATMLNYGDVYVQTAAEKERFVFKQIPFASDVARRISTLVSEARRKQGMDL